MSSELNSIVFNLLPGVYRDPSRIINDVASLRSTELGLRLHPRAEPLILNDGSSSNVLMLQGTLPMTYRGADYHIPIDLYVPPLYPARPPIIYVRPVPSMTINVNHSNVGQDGMVYMPYLHNWNADTHDLTELAACLSSIFGDDPPCYHRKAVTVDPTPPPPPPYPQPTGRPVNIPPPPYINPEINDARKRAEAISAATSEVRLAMKSLCDSTREDLRVELRDQKRLEAGKRRIDELLKEGEKQKAKLIAENVELAESTRTLEQWLAAVKEEQQQRQGQRYDDGDEGGVMTDLIAIPADTRSAQMLALSAESAAIDDCIYYLDMALVHRRLSLEVFLREVRRLTKRQSLAKAHLMMIKNTQTGGH
ncbi:hypothetical protein ACHAXA_007055 [Cyclostephanos tholiformis]|uniref:Tumor susceptibility protein 101 n=1 Tax=Cyclostephanos tholiformis TaxID=382380 RepID=A0ABD3RB26_9STRA